MKKLQIRLVCLFLLSIPFQVHAALDVLACFESQKGKILQGTQGVFVPPDIKISPNVDGQDCIFINSVAYKVEQTVNLGVKSGGAGAGKAIFNPLTIVKNVDLMSPYLFVRMASGEFFKSVNIFFYDQRGIPSNQQSIITFTPVMQLQLGLVYIKSINVAAQTGDSLGNNENVELEYGEIVTTVYGQNASGVRTQIKQGWDRVKNVSMIKSANITEYTLQ
jgi:type VI protein secretion system component Hcp